jgi:hypothetical protein
MTTPDRAKPKGFRRIERWGVGLVMGILALVLEKAVLRSIRRGGGKDGGHENDGGRANDTKITTKGGDVEFRPEP